MLPTLSADGLPEGMPDRYGVLTLGWDVLAWAEQMLAQPDGDRAGECWEWTASQARIIAWWYAVDPDGQWLHRRGQIVLPKGAGKSPLAAALSCCELAGPVLFDGTDAEGNAVGRPHPSPHVQLAAVSQDQTDNTMSLVLAMLREGTAADEVAGLDLGVTRVRTRNGSLRPVTASAPSREGQRLTAAILDEPHLWVQSNGGVRLAATLRRNLGKMNGRSIEPLALDTPVPTPMGWTTVGAVKPGDHVYGSDGRSVEVKFVTETFEGKDCYRVTFDDGEQIVASGTHGWTVRRQHKKKLRDTRNEVVTCTTTELAATADRFNLSVPLVEVHGIDACLPVDPYFLGLWLGEGATDDSVVCCDAKLTDELAAIVKGSVAAHEDLVIERGADGRVSRLRPRRKHRLCRWGHDWSCDEAPNGTTCGQCVRKEPRIAEPLLTMRERLRAIGVLGRKHIPPAYLRASVEQRRALLQGLMDSDETIGERGRATFRNTNVKLIEQTAELLVSLGYKVSTRWYDYPERGLPAGHVSFVPTADKPVTRLAYKTARHRSERGPWSNRRFIRSVDPVPSVPTRCVGIDTDDHLFVVGRRNTLTHNTTNCWIPGQDSVAESTAAYADKIAEGKHKKLSGLLRYHPQAPVKDLGDEAELRAGLAELYFDSPWIDIDRLVAEVQDLGTDPSDARRFYLNQITAATDSWLSQPEVAAIADATKVIADGEAITLGFDGSRRRVGTRVADATALIGCRVCDGHLFELGVWEQPQGVGGENWDVPVSEVTAAVESAFKRYAVVGFYCDPSRWESQVIEWEGRYGKKLKVKAARDHPCHWWFSQRNGSTIVRATEALHSAIVHEQVTFDGSYALMRHLLNARRRLSRSGIQIHKEHPESEKKIDAAVSAILAFQARSDAVGAGVQVSNDRRHPRKIFRY